MTPAERVRTYEARLKQRGGRRMPGGMLQPNVAHALDELVRVGYAPSQSAVIAKALLDAARYAPKV